MKFYLFEFNTVLLAKYELMIELCFQLCYSGTYELKTNFELNWIQPDRTKPNPIESIRCCHGEPHRTYSNFLIIFLVFFKCSKFASIELWRTCISFVSIQFGSDSQTLKVRRFHCMFNYYDKHTVKLITMITMIAWCAKGI